MDVAVESVMGSGRVAVRPARNDAEVEITEAGRQLARFLFGAGEGMPAVRFAREWEAKRGAFVQDVSTPSHARRAGLHRPNFDLLAVYPDGETRVVEVKPLAQRDAKVRVEADVWKKAVATQQPRWLYAVLDFAAEKPNLVRVPAADIVRELERKNCAFLPARFFMERAGIA